MQEQWRLERASISDAINRRRRVRQRISDGELWLDHHCLFHDDRHRSASWCENTGTYFCHAEDKSFPVTQVLEILLVPQSTSKRHRSQPRPLPPIPNATIYTYLWPDGRPSHLKLRWGDGDLKQVVQTDLDFNFRLPADTYPIYGDYDLQRGLHLLIVEGEKCVDRVRAVRDGINDTAITAITTGSSASLRKFATQLAIRIGELRPQTITLWPDNDESGLAAMRYVHLALQDQNLAHSMIKPAELGLPLKGDVCDYLDQNGSLAVLIAKQSGALEIEPVMALLEKTQTASGMMIFPQSRDLRVISDDNGRALWMQTYNTLPSTKQLQEFLARLRIKTPIALSPRAYTNERVTWWRPNNTHAYRISAQGVELDDDPDGVFLLAPEDGRHVDTSVDELGTRSDLEALLAPWTLTDTEVAMIEGWLVCAMGGLQTPILFMRSPAATGKTTLARFLLSVVEPMCPEMEAKAMQDARHFALSLMEYPVALIDNVSRMDSSVEDMLSRLVTGYTASLRPLYQDRVITLFLRRGIIITTTNWDIYKGDLASRTVVVEPKKKESGNAADRYLQARYMPLIPKVRHYVMTLLSTYYQRRHLFEQNVHFRIGDLGVVFATLGYDTSELARQEAVARSQVVTMEDPRLEAIVGLWEEAASEMIFYATQEINDYFRHEGLEVWPANSPRLARWFAEKAPFFVDHGFSVERVNNINPKGYRFRRADSH